MCKTVPLQETATLPGAMMTVAKKPYQKVLDSLLADCKAGDLIGENGLLKQLLLLVEKALEAEMADHLGHSKHKAGGEQQ